MLRNAKKLECCQLSSWAKLPCSIIALNRWIRTEICWNKKLASLSSPDWREILVHLRLGFLQRSWPGQPGHSGHDAWQVCLGPSYIQTKPWRPSVSTEAPQWHWCVTNRVKPSRRQTPIDIASSPSVRPHDDMGMAKSQSPLCGDEAARKQASPNCVLKLDLLL